MQGCFANSSLRVSKGRHFWEVIGNQLSIVSSRAKKEGKLGRGSSLLLANKPKVWRWNILTSLSNHFSVQKSFSNPNLNPQLQRNSSSASNNSRSYGDFYLTSWGLPLNTGGNLFLSSELNGFQLLGSDQMSFIRTIPAQVFLSIQNHVGK